MPKSRDLTHYLWHFGEAGCPVCERQCQLRDARLIIYVTSGRRVAQFARDSANFVAPNLLFTSLLRGGSRSDAWHLGPRSSAGIRGDRRDLDQPTSPNSLRGRVPPPFPVQWVPHSFSAAPRPVRLFSGRNTTPSCEISDPAAASAANSSKIGSSSSRTRGSGAASRPVCERQG